VSLATPQRAAISRAVFAAEFARGERIADAGVLAPLVEAPRLDPAETLEHAQSDANKRLLKAQTARAAEIGLRGAPCLVTTDYEIFWGNDRLEHDAATKRGASESPAKKPAAANRAGKSHTNMRRRVKNRMKP